MITQKWERWSLRLVMAAAAILAALVPVGHVVAWTLVHSPPGTSWLAGATNATISELMPFAGIVAYRICRRSDRSVVLPVVLFILGAGLSLNAQLDMASPGISGAIASAAPTAAVMLITKTAIALLAPHERATIRREVAQATHAAPPAPEPVAELPEPEPIADRSEPEPPSESCPPEPAPVPGSRTSTRGKRGGLPASLTSAGKVEATAKKLGADTPIAKIASEAGVSVSTARRYLPRPRPSQAEALPATAQVS